MLWALGDEHVREQVAEAHQATWCRAFAHIEREAALTRTGTAGVAQVNTNGLVAAVFDHPDSRTGDSNLHMHVAVSANMQGLDGMDTPLRPDALGGQLPAGQTEQGEPI